MLFPRGKNLVDAAAVQAMRLTRFADALLKAARDAPGENDEFRTGFDRFNGTPRYRSHSEGGLLDGLRLWHEWTEREQLLFRLVWHCGREQSLGRRKIRCGGRENINNRAAEERVNGSGIIPAGTGNRCGAGILLPALFAPDAATAKRVFEFFTANIRNPPYAESLRPGGGGIRRLV